VGSGSMRSLLVATLVVSASAFFASTVGHATVNSRAAVAPTMKHHEFYQRISRAEAGRMRLCIVRTNNHIYAQVVDDAKGHVLVSASTVEKGGRKEYGGNCDSAIEVGKRIASRAIEKGVEQVYFDRNGFKYHGRVAALADAAREAGLSF